MEAFFCGIMLNVNVIIVACIYEVQIKIWESQSGLPPDRQRGQTTFNHVYAKLFLKIN